MMMSPLLWQGNKKNIYVMGGCFMNVLENIPYQEQKMGSRKLVDEKYLLVMQAALKPGQGVPQHNANSNVHILVVKGAVVINLNGTQSLAQEGSLVPVIHKTSMNVMNKSNQNASFLIIKTPNPSEMVGEELKVKL
jgi:quercetin dioxygenase-like cupin family protein